ncbi:MAG: RNA-binding protein [Acidobacteriia bacterium]|nr:RNA-binding protein [Terriglobia bacterium]
MAFGCRIRSDKSVVLDSDRRDPCFFLPISAENSQSHHHEPRSNNLKKIYVGNFPFSMTEPELRSLFEPYGNIESVSLATDRDTGRSRGFGFVTMPNDDEAEKAMAGLNGKDSNGRALTVNEAKPQAPRRDGGRGGDRPKREPRW